MPNFLRQGARAVNGRALVILSQSQAAGVKVERLNPRWRPTNECCISVRYGYFTFKDSKFVIFKKEKCLGSVYNYIECNHIYTRILRRQIRSSVAIEHENAA